ncbi:MAG: DUF3536 domain-containing protein [Acidimicrobiales bacterium]
MAPVAGFHLHLYQPPREDPWLGLVTNEWSAWPYHDWNERITAECYRALTAVVVAPGADDDTELVEPLPVSSFDVGTTLHAWLERAAPDVDEAWRHQARRASGGASAVAMAAPLVHAILPLATAADRDRLVTWGVADFTHRFGEAPRGMWLPETAVDLATLETLADHDVAYTVLMPGQAARVREGDGEWREVHAETLDTSRAYRVRLASGRALTVVFGHRDLSQRVAFGDLVDNGSRLADVMAATVAGGDGAVMLVADGETFGHHHRFGDVGLAWALRRLRRHYGLETALGEWLAVHEPTHEVELAPVSSWSCAHGVERWRSDCGCVTGGQSGWRQGWRAPLRASLDWLRERLGAALEERLGELVTSVDAVLGDYGRVVAGAVEPAAFAHAHARGSLDDNATTTVLELCELYRHLLYSFTSCAWFFSDPAEIETFIVLREAAVAMEIAQRALGLDLAGEFLERFSAVHSNQPGVDGPVIWERACESARVDEAHVAAGFAAESFAGGDRARRTRGDWRAEVARGKKDPGKFVVTLTHAPTERRRVFRARVERGPGLDLRVDIGDGATRHAMELGELGDDVVARVVAAWLVSPGSVAFADALDLLVARLLSEPAEGGDARALVALATSLKCATPANEASIRRGLLALRGPADTGADHPLLGPLTRAVELVGPSPVPGKPAAPG